MAWTFDNNKPIYLQIVEKIEREILSGKLEKGEKISSVRDLAIEASVNPNTMQRALQELENRGLVTVQRTSGRQVTQDDEIINLARTQLAQASIQNFVFEMKNLGFGCEQTKKIIEQEW